MRRGLTILVLGAVLMLPSDRTCAGHATFGCSECHISHGPQGGDGESGPLWSSLNTDDGLPTFSLYSSRTFDALRTDIGQPDGASKLCLGCHDGTYRGFEAASSGRGTKFGSGDLAATHPVSFTYDSSLAARVPHSGLRDPAIAASGLGGTIAGDLLDARGKVQCTSCHDVHATGKGSKHLRYDYDPSITGGDGMCRVCHNR